MLSRDKTGSVKHLIYSYSDWVLGLVCLPDGAWWWLLLCLGVGFLYWCSGGVAQRHKDIFRSTPQRPLKSLRARLRLEVLKGTIKSSKDMKCTVLSHKQVPLMHERH